MANERKKRGTRNAEHGISTCIPHSAFRVPRFFALPIIVLGVAFQSCQVGPNYQRPKLEMPATYKSATQPATQAAPALGTNWWVLFNDPQLTSLEEVATKHNPDIEAAVQRVIQA